MDFWHQARNLIFYGWGSQVEGGATLMRNKAHVFVDKEWLPWLNTGMAWELNDDSLGDAALGSEAKNANAGNLFTPSGSSRASMLRASLVLGRLDWDGWLVQGASLETSFERSLAALGADSEFSRFNADGRAFILWRGQNLGLRLAGSHSDAPQLSQQAFLGGLESVRGFVHGRFRGRAWWLANLEWRAPLYSSKVLALQSVAFWDAARTSAYWESLISGGSGGQGAGAGLRIILPKIYRLNLRADFGWALDGSERGFSFGLQQFF
jgi:hypothetical protein